MDELTYRSSNDCPNLPLFNQMTRAYFNDEETWKKIKALLQEEVRGEPAQDESTEP
jgi:hypothetical protein